MVQENVFRRDLLTACFSKQAVSRVEIKEVTLPPTGKADYHLHRCPVVGCIVSGALLYQLKGGDPMIIKTGEAFFEPRDQPVLHFDNASETEPLVFTAFYLVEENEDLITILPDVS